MTGEDGGRGLPMWARVTAFFGGLGMVFYEVVNEPRWVVLLVALTMMGYVSPDILDKWKGGPR
jgi:hypothetical protein